MTVESTRWAPTIRRWVVAVLVVSAALAFAPVALACNITSGSSNACQNAGACWAGGKQYPSAPPYSVKATMDTYNPSPVFVNSSGPSRFM